MIILSVIFYNEILVYFNTFRSWPDVEKQRIFKILFVADPVIIYNLLRWIIYYDTRILFL